MKKPNAKYTKGQTVNTGFDDRVLTISKNPKWNGFTWMYSFAETDMSCGENYLRLTVSEIVNQD